MRGYKLVTKLPSGKLISLVAKGEAEVEYIPRKWVEAPKWLAEKGYYLTFFPTFPSSFWHGFSNIELYECEVQGVIREKDLPSFCSLSLIEIGLVDRVGLSRNSWLKGTWMAKKIKLIRPFKTSKTHNHKEN